MSSEGLICEYKDCCLILENPITLSCGFTLCQKHLEKFSDNFECFFCDKVHQMPNEGFGVNRSLNKIIDAYFENDPLKQKIRKSFENLSESIDNYLSIIPDAYVYDYFEKIRNKLDLHREELFKEITERSDEMLNQLKDKEDKCKQNLNKAVKVNNEKLINEEIPAWKLSLRNPQINQNELKELSSKLDENFNQIQNQAKRFKKDLLLGENIQFEKYEKRSLLGKLTFKSAHLSPKCGELIREYKEHSGTIRSIQVYEKLLISGSTDKTIKIWDLETGECLKTLTDHKHWVTSILIIPNNKFLSGSCDKTIKIWDLNSYACLKTLTNESEVYSLCLISDNQIACGCNNGSISIWNLDNSTKVKSFKAHDDWILYLLFVDNSKLISCSGKNDKKIKIWRIETLECINMIEGHLDTIYNLELTSNGNLLSCSNDKTVKLWQIETGEMLKSIEYEHPVYCVKELNEDLIAVGLHNGEIQIYDLNKMENIKTISAHSSFLVYRLKVLSNGGLISGIGQGDIRLCEIL
jgi:WD40 repeat protein